MPAGAFFLRKSNLSEKNKHLLYTEHNLNIVRCFFDFFKDVWDETIGFESISGKHLSKNGLKTYTFVRDIPKKVKKHCARAASCSQVPRLPINLSQMEFIRGSSGIKRINRIFRNQPDQVSSAAARTLPSTRAGGQDDVSYTNSLKQFSGSGSGSVKFG